MNSIFSRIFFISILFVQDIFSSMTSRVFVDTVRDILLEISNTINDFHGTEADLNAKLDSIMLRIYNFYVAIQSKPDLVQRYKSFFITHDLILQLKSMYKGFLNLQIG